MKKKRTATALKVQAEEKKPKIEVKHETSEEEEEEEEDEEEIEEVEVSESEEVEEEDNEQVEEEEEFEEVEEEEEEEEDEDDEEEDDDEEEEEEDEESSKKETLRKLLEPLPKDRIIELLKEAVLNDRSIVDSLIHTAEVDPAHRKIFVFGLGWDATTNQLQSVFKKYGEIEECTVVTDKVTGKAKGYGFVLFKTRKSAKKSLKNTQKKIGNRFTTCQLAAIGPGEPSNKKDTTGTPDPTGRKIFVANVKPHVNPNALRTYFAKFGEIEDGPLGIDNVTGKFKGFTMFVYKTVDGLKKALEVPNKVFDGCKLECRQAVENQRGNKNKKTNNNMQPGGSNNSEIGNMGYGYGLYPPQLMNPTGGIMIGQNPMLVSGLNQGSSGYGMSTVSPGMMANYGAQLGLHGLGPYQNTQVGRASGGGNSSQVAARERSGRGSLEDDYPSYHGR
ncbi:UBP1-associated protein 2B-like [Rutidosis leptorrhynchoides]|uniref:UBP1-associated protein 2B-like n=1 Tax=Rutidosis leptorrhynchoides TaxID=125765 RepID=UPI003A995171